MYASGKWAKAICDRCGFAVRYFDIVEEQGTGWRVCSRCDDGHYSLVSHPQNNIRGAIDPEGLEHARPDVTFTSVSAYTPPS